MLSILMKHEWKYIGKKFLLLILVTAVATAMGMLSFSGIGMMGVGDNPIAAFLVIAGLIAYYGILIVVSFGFVILSAIRFYKNIYGDEAYITHTLPVTAGEIHNAKVIVYTICEIILTCVLMISIYLVVNGVVVNSADSSVEYMGIPSIMEMMGLSGAGTVLLLSATIIVSSFANITITYASIVLGQYWKKNKVLGAVVWYVILTMVLSILATAGMTPVMGTAIAQEMTGEITSINLVASNLMTTTFLITTIISLVVGIAAYIVADYGLKKKLNLE